MVACAPTRAKGKPRPQPLLKFLWEGQDRAEEATWLSDRSWGTQAAPACVRAGHGLSARETLVWYVS